MRWIAPLWRALGVRGELIDRSVVSDWSCEQSVVRTGCSVRGSSYLRVSRNRTPSGSGVSGPPRAGWWNGDAASARASVRSASPVTSSALLKGIGRAVLWVVLVVLLLRGAADVMAVADPAPVAREAPAPPAWPDDEARAFAAGLRACVSELLAAATGTATRARSAVRRARVAGLDRARSSATTRPAQAVQGVTVARTARVDQRRALVTVAATVAARSRRAVSGGAGRA